MTSPIIIEESALKEIRYLLELKGLEIPGIREIANENIPKMRKVQTVYKMDWDIFTLMNKEGRWFVKEEDGFYGVTNYGKI